MNTAGGKCGEGVRGRRDEGVEGVEGQGMARHGGRWRARHGGPLGGMVWRGLAGQGMERDADGGARYGGALGCKV